jgi:integrase/recombinase XerD
METALIPAAGPPSQADSDAQAIALWLHGKSPHSRRAYAGDIERFRQFIPERPLPAVRLADLQAFADTLQELAPATRTRILAAVKSLLAFSHRIGYVPYNVGAAMTLKRPKRTLAERIMTREATVKMLALETTAKKRTILQFLYETGARASELCALAWRDVQPRERGQAQATLFGKGDRTRAVLFSGELMQQLELLRGNSGPDVPVFKTRTGKPMDEPALFRIVRAAAARAGMKQAVSPHWLRHACASHALDAGAPISLVQAQLGHASLETTSAYVHARPEDGLFNYLKRA